MTSDSWRHLTRFTSARIALGRSGASVPTHERLDFQLSHAMARDAVLEPFYPEVLAAALTGLPVPCRIIESRAPDRSTYLRRPDLGRRLADSSRETLGELRSHGPWDLMVMVSDGLSSHAAMRQSRPLLDGLLPLFLEAGWRVAPILATRHARVAIQDEAGALLDAEMSLILLGERPGLGSPDSLGAYFTFRPAPGRTDAERNCVSNIRPEGLPPASAAEKLFHLLTKSRRLRLSGVGLKDDTGSLQGSPAHIPQIPV